MQVELLLVVERRCPGLIGKAFAVHAVAARAVRLVDVVAALDGDDLLVRLLGPQPARVRDARDPELVEVIEDHEQDDDHRREEPDPPRVGALADDSGRPLGRQLEGVGARWRAEALCRGRLGVRTASRQTLLGRLLLLGRLPGLVGHRAPRDRGRIRLPIRCIRSGSAGG